MTSLQDAIISAFLDQNRNELTDAELTAAVAKTGISYELDTVRRHVRSLSPALFQLTTNTDQTLVIRVEPKIEICEEYRTTRCPAPAKTCEKLHICRYFGRCHRPGCGHPHDLTKGYNRQIVANHRCHQIAPLLLVNLLLRKTPIRPRENRHSGFRRGSRGRRPRHQRIHHTTSLRDLSKPNDDFDCQVNVSLPSLKITNRVTITDIQRNLIQCDIGIGTWDDGIENDHFRRFSITFERSTDIEKLLQNPIQDCKGVKIKFKPTKSIIDTNGFLLKLSIHDEQDKIEFSHLHHYITELVDDNPIKRPLDISTDTEQILYVKCAIGLDFNRIRQRNLSQPRLSDKDISINQVYQCDSLNVRYCNGREINANGLERIFRAVWSDVFFYNISNSTSADVEFVDSNAFERCMSMIDEIEQQANVIIIPLIDSVEENSIDSRSTISNDTEGQIPRITIPLRVDWALIVNHQSFGVEYKDFIRKELGGEVEIEDETATYTGRFPVHLQSGRHDMIFANKTNDFARKFQVKTFENLDDNQIKILRTNPNLVAYDRLQQNDYLVATKPSTMSKLEYQFSARTTAPRLESPITPERSSFISSLSTATYDLTNSNEINMFSIEKFERKFQQYIEETFQVKLTHKRERNNLTLELTGSRKTDLDNAIRDIKQLFSLLSTKKFTESINNFWTRIEDSIEMLNHHFKLIDMICFAEHISPNMVHVYHFGTHPQFGIDEQRIEELIKDRFQYVRLNLEPISKVTNNWQEFIEQIQHEEDYRKDICLLKESTIIHLFGLRNLVQSARQKFEQLTHKYESQPSKITLSDHQLKYLTYVAKSDMNKLEKEYQSQGCDVSLSRLNRTCEFLAPVHLHTEIKDKILALAQIRVESFEMSNPALDLLLSKEFERILSIVKPRCYLEKTVQTFHEHIPVPRARVPVSDDEMQSTASARPTTTTTMNIGRSTVTILMGDLTRQEVDAIVVYSSSPTLCSAIVDAAGPETRMEYLKLRASNGFPDSISGGGLPCKKIIFSFLEPISRDLSAVQEAINEFIGTAFLFIDNCKSLAFPAIGCGQFNFDPILIARTMLSAIRDQLKASQSKMNISFVLLPGEKNVYDAFVQCLKELEAIDLSVTPRLPTTKKDDRPTLPFQKNLVRITLISSNDKDLIKCKNEIVRLVDSYSTDTQHSKQDLLDWTQDAIDKYYAYCLKLRVIPTIDLDKTTLELTGTKDAVHEAEKYFLELTAEILKEQRIQALSRGIIWSVELQPHSDNWEQYSYRLNGMIEDAFTRKRDYIDFENERSDQCRIDFSRKKEITASTSRRVRRVLVDSTLPSTWENSHANCIRVSLSSTSNEFKDVRQRFDATMFGRYSRIIKIERIQNERWYKQYAAHREDFRKRYGNENERLLFHGCSSTSADQIINSCFNRTFAGVNGVKYGHGVYFHTQASYSHQYAMKNITGERTVFLVRVLIGRTCQGNSSMKVTPNGYDTTTDGEDIFVVYHDAGAYAEYLITYRGE